MPWNDFSSSLITDTNHRITKILDNYEEQANLYLKEFSTFEGTIDDYTNHKNDLAVLSQGKIFYILQKESFELEPKEFHATKFIAKNETSLLLSSSISGDLLLFDTVSQESIQVKVENLQSNEEITGGIIQNSTNDKLSLLISTNQGRLFRVKKR